MRVTIDRGGAVTEITFTPEESDARNVLEVEAMLRGLVDSDDEPLLDPLDIPPLARAIVSGLLTRQVLAEAIKCAPVVR